MAPGTEQAEGHLRVMATSGNAPGENALPSQRRRIISTTAGGGFSLDLALVEGIVWDVEIGIGIGGDGQAEHHPQARQQRHADDPSQAHSRRPLSRARARIS